MSWEIATSLLPFEFTIQGPPVSHQTKNKTRLQAWITDVKTAATAAWPAGIPPIATPLQVEIVYYYMGDDRPDVDNIIKPIQDAMIGVVYVDDNQVHKTGSSKRSMDGSYSILGARPAILQAFSNRREILHIKVMEHFDDGGIP